PPAVETRVEGLRPMSTDLATAYDQLTPEEAAHVDAVCDRFEHAWQGTRAGGPVPRLASYTGRGEGPAREVLFRELIALDEACRQPYGAPVRPEAPNDLGAAAGPPPTPPPRPLHRRTDPPAGPSANWPSIPGLELVDVVGSGGMGVVFR